MHRGAVKDAAGGSTDAVTPPVADNTSGVRSLSRCLSQRVSRSRSGTRSAEAGAVPVGNSSEMQLAGKVAHPHREPLAPAGGVDPSAPAITSSPCAIDDAALAASQHHHSPHSCAHRKAMQPGANENGAGRQKGLPTAHQKRRRKVPRERASPPSARPSDRKASGRALRERQRSLDAMHSADASANVCSMRPAQLDVVTRSAAEDCPTVSANVTHSAETCAGTVCDAVCVQQQTVAPEDVQRLHKRKKRHSPNVNARPVASTESSAAEPRGDSLALAAVPEKTSRHQQKLEHVYDC